MLYLIVESLLLRVALENIDADVFGATFSDDIFIVLVSMFGKLEASTPTSFPNIEWRPVRLAMQICIKRHHETIARVEKMRQFVPSENAGSAPVDWLLT